jgi:FkbM family methyltransferase
MKIVNWIMREISLRYISKIASEHILKYPQMCCYSFDSIAIDINIYGRCDLVEMQKVLNIIDLKQKNVLDIGANIGNHTAIFAEVANKVYAFEPHPNSFKLLDINLSKYKNVKIFNLGLSDKQSILTAVSPHRNIGASAISNRLAEKNESIWEFNCVKLDDVKEIENISLIKIDVEGHEYQALKGAEKLLMKEKPIILLEQNADVIYDNSSQSVELLKKIGYEYIYHIEGYLNWRTNFLKGNLRKFLRIMEIILFGPPDYVAKINRIQKLENRDYSLLILSCVSIEVD